MKTAIRTVIILVCLSVILLCFIGCDDTTVKHVFNFNTPDNFDSLSIEEQLEWGRENGYLVVNDALGELVVENNELLYSFLENKSEKRELLIMKCYKDYTGIKNSLIGIYFDGKSYYASLDSAELPKDTLYKYETLGIEEYIGYKFLYLSNDKSLSPYRKFSGKWYLRTGTEEYQFVVPLSNVSKDIVKIHHAFNYNTPENFDALTVEKQLEWGRENGYLIIKHLNGETVLENEELLYSFLENNTEAKELLFMQCYDNTVLVNFLSGIYFDGEYYYTNTINELHSDVLERYEICGIEEYKGRRYLYVSNDNRITCDDEYSIYLSSIIPLDFHLEFSKYYRSIASLGDASEN